ncbi:Protein OS-9 [Vanrija albida]|uniref:Protein OS-9 homolog n=1 Tax=Vanrija albida TaxID=181172 RepID=A0ABR3PXZ4_9TREE
MSHLAIYLLGVAALSARTTRATHSGLQDLAAFPKYEVHFLPEPIAQSDASRVRQTGLAHDDDWLELRPQSRALDGADAEGSDSGGENVSFDPPTTVSFMPLHYTPPGTDNIATYLCAMPSLNVTESQRDDNERYENDEPEPDPAASWQALNHLDGKCLYLRHAWFTYSYCHNSHLRQFRALQHDQHPHIAGADPEEDPAFDAYLLGQAYPTSKKGKAALPPGQQRRGAAPKGEVGPVAQGPVETPAEQVSTFGVGPASRYLKQRWTDGTRCDKTGRPREVEVQVHCSMTSTDVLYMVKEITTCQYVVVIHSPNLCSLPGFRPSSSDHIVPAPIRCRQVVSDEEMDDWLDAGVAGEEKTWGVDAPRLPDRPREEIDVLVDRTRAKEKQEQGEADATLLLGKIDKETIRQLEKVLGASFGLTDDDKEDDKEEDEEVVATGAVEVEVDEDAKPPLLIDTGRNEPKPKRPDLGQVAEKLLAPDADKAEWQKTLKLVQQLIQAELDEEDDAPAQGDNKPAPPRHDETLAAPDAPPRDEL